MVFSAAINSLFADPHLSKQAIYNDGISRAVKAILTNPQEDVSMFRTDAWLPAWLADIRKSEVSQPVEGATLTVEGQTYRISSPKLDSARLVWRMNLDPL